MNVHEHHPDTFMVPVLMASVTSVVQKMELTAMTTWPGHSSTHLLRGTSVYAETELLVTSFKLRIITSCTRSSHFSTMP